PVERHGAAPGAVVDAVLAVERGRAHQHEVEPHLAGEIVLRQRRALIGQRILVADEDDLAVEPALAQRGGKLEPAMPGAEDDDAGHRHQVCASGIVTTSPSICGDTTSWHDSRLLARRGLAVPSSIASSPTSISGHKPS